MSQASAVPWAAAAALLLGLVVLGAFLRAMARMSADLRARKSEIAAARLEQFHNERMMLLGGIAAGMAHEIGNPAAVFAAVAAEIEAAQRAGRAPVCEAREMLAAAGRLAAITRRLALIAGLRSRAPGPVALNAIVESVTALVSLDARFASIALHTELDGGVHPIVAAEDDVVQLLLHLLMNAAESFEGAAQGDPRILVATLREGDGAALEIADNGRGMDAATLARAFEPFFTTKPAGRGNGLGLDACRRLVERHGGTIRLESSPGEGTRALCRFPAAGLGAPAVIDSGRHSGIGT